MALSGYAVWEVHSVANDATASDANGGGFDSSNKGATGVDLTQGTYQAVHTFSASLSGAGTTALTDSAAGFSNTMLGNMINIAGQGVYCIVGYTNSGHVTLDRASGTFSAASGVVGGAFATPGYACGLAVQQNIIYLQNVGADGATVYSITSATSNVSGGCLNPTYNVVQGYTTNRTTGNTDPRPCLQLNVASATLSPGNYYLFAGLVLDGNSQTSARAGNGLCNYYNCLFKKFNTASGSASLFVACAATLNSAAVFVGTSFACESYANSAMIFSGTGSTIDCVAYGNTASGFNVSLQCIGCVAYGNTGSSSDGFVNTGGQSVGVLVNCIAENNGRYGFNVLGGKVLANCSAYNNTSGNSIDARLVNLGFVPVTVGSVFAAPGSNNFALNNLANRGALLRAAGFPATSVDGASANYLDIGAFQHQDSGGGASVVIPVEEW
jgi:hypothetical protein